MHGQDIIVRYLQDAQAAERNFEDALSTFSGTGAQEDVKSLMGMMSQKARTQHERLAHRIQALGGDTSTAKSALAHMLAFPPTLAQMGHTAEEKNTQHLMIVIAAAAAEMAMYESLASAAQAAGDRVTEQLARELQSEEREDYELAWDSLRQSAVRAFESVKDQERAIKAYLEDAIAAEKNFETQLRGMAKEGDNEQVHRMFTQHADETRTQYEMLTSRLERMGGSPSTLKSFLAHLFGLSPKTAQMGHDEADRVTQNLMMAYSVEQSEVAMYESLATVAQQAGDDQTVALAREIQAQEKATGDLVWSVIAPNARMAFEKLAQGEPVVRS